MKPFIEFILLKSYFLVVAVSVVQVVVDLATRRILILSIRLLMKSLSSTQRLVMSIFFVLLDAIVSITRLLALLQTCLVKVYLSLKILLFLAIQILHKRANGRASHTLLAILFFLDFQVLFSFQLLRTSPMDSCEFQVGGTIGVMPF